MTPTADPPAIDLHIESPPHMHLFQESLHSHNTTYIQQSWPSFTTTITTKYNYGHLTCSVSHSIVHDVEGWNTQLTTSQTKSSHPPTHHTTQRRGRSHHTIGNIFPKCGISTLQRSITHNCKQSHHNATPHAIHFNESTSPMLQYYKLRVNNKMENQSAKKRRRWLYFHVHTTPTSGNCNPPLEHPRK